MEKIRLQLFAEDTVVNTTGSNDLSSEMKTYYEKRLIDIAEPKLVHDQFGDKYPINRGGTVSVEGGVKLLNSLPFRSTLNVFTLPASLVPRRRQVLAIFSDNGLFRLDIGTNGNAAIKNLTGSTFPTSTYLSLACTYSI